MSRKKVNPELIVLVKELYSHGVVGSEIAKAVNVSETTVYKIIHNKEDEHRPQPESWPQTTMAEALKGRTFGKPKPSSVKTPTSGGLLRARYGARDYSPISCGTAMCSGL